MEDKIHLTSAERVMLMRALEDRAERLDELSETGYNDLRDEAEHTRELLEKIEDADAVILEVR